MSTDRQFWMLSGRAKDAGLTAPTRAQVDRLDNDSITAALAAIASGIDYFADTSRSGAVRPSPDSGRALPAESATGQDERLLSLLERIADALECACQRSHDQRRPD